MSEHDEQAAVIAWAKLNETRYPALEFLHSTPNGGYRHPAVAARMKAEGVKRGVLDLQLPMPAGPYHGLWIEMKFGKGRLSKQQKVWVNQLTAWGHYVEVCWDANAAIDVITAYLEMVAT